MWPQGKVCGPPSKWSGSWHMTHALRNENLQTWSMEKNCRQLLDCAEVEGKNLEFGVLCLYPQNEPYSTRNIKHPSSLDISESSQSHLMTPRFSTLPQSGYICPNKPTQPHQLSFPLHWKWSLQPLHGQPQSCTTWNGMLACSKSGDTGCIRDV